MKDYAVDCLTLVHSITVNAKEDPDPAPKAQESVKNEHVHDWTEGVIYEANPTSDGLEGTYCKTCGAIKESRVISAYEYSLFCKSVSECRISALYYVSVNVYRMI